MRSTDASRCSAVVLPLIKDGNTWFADCTKARIAMVPLTSLGRRVDTVASEAASSFTISSWPTEAGGPKLRSIYLSEDLFDADSMGTANSLMQMKVAELKEALTERNLPTTGSKAWLRRRLHAEIVRLHLEAQCDDDALSD